METKTENQKPNLVLGRVTDKQNRPLPNLSVHIYDRDMRSEQLLKETVTDKEGKYEVAWLHSQLSGRGVKEADISVKVFTRENKTLLYASDIDSIRFNASSREEINIIIPDTIRPEIVEYDSILKNTTYLANKIAITDLQESKEHQDISFISKELKIGSEKVVYLVLAHRLQAISKIDAAFFYALLRKDTLLKNDFTNSLNARLSIGINTDTQSLLYDAALADSKTILKDVQVAAKEMIISSKVVKESKRNVELLQQYKQRAEEYYKNEHPKKVISTISKFVLDGKIQEVQNLFEENKNDLNVFFEKITSPSFFSSETNSTHAKTNVVLAQLFGTDNDIIPHILKSKKITKPEDVKRLAKLNKKDWVNELTNVKDRSGLNAGNKNTIGLMASNIVRKMEKEFPTVAFTAQLEREKKPILKNHDAIVSFLSKHEDFDLEKHNVDLFLKEKKVARKEGDTIKEELKSIQRVFKLVPNYSKVNALHKENIHSAQSIVAAGETRFVNEIAPKAGIKTKEAKRIFKKASSVNTAAMLIVGELQDTMRAMDIAAIETSSLAKKLEAVSKDFPNLKTLFKLTDTCACEHCRSVYSPAAYLVELLQFLNKRSVTDVTVIPHITSNLAKDVLFERRPDLGDIDLGCENANTPVKYIDLVCELLEEATAPDPGINYTGVLSDGADPLKGKISAALLSTLQTAGLPVTDQALVFETEVTTGSSATLPHYLRDKKVVCKVINTGGNKYKIFRLKQTLSSAAELDAAPEYVNLDAYKELSKQTFAFKLPFDLNHTEAKAYFNRFDLSRAALMQDFQVSGIPADESIASEKLDLTDAERKLIVSPKATLVDQQLIWNAPAQWDNPPINGNVLDYMKRVDHFLDKTGLTYKELDLLLALSFIDPNDKLFIKHLDLTCDTAKKEIANLDEAALDRIHRFLRLQKKTGWKLEVLNEIISQTKLGNDSLVDACLIQAALLKQISEKTGIKIDELIGFYGEIPHEELNDNAPTPLYQQLFLNKAKNGFIDEHLLPEKVNGSQLLSNLTTTLSVSLQIKEQDLEKLLPLLPDGKLNFSNLSYLLAASRLIKKLKLKTDDFVILIGLTNLNISDSPKKTLDFINAAEEFKKSPLKAADVKFMLRHEAADIPNIDDKIKQILEKLQKDYQSNFALNKSRFDDTLSANEQGETLQNELSKLNGIAEEDVKTFLEFIDKDWTSAANAKNFVDVKLGSLFNTTQIKNKIDELEGVALTKAQDILDHETALLALRSAQDLLKKATTPAEIATANAALAAAQAQLVITTSKYNIASGRNLLKAFLDSIAVFQLEAGKQVILEQTISTSFKADLELIKVVFKYAELKQPAPGKGLLSNLLQTDALIDTNTTHVIPVLPAVTKIAFSNQYAALMLLQKLLPLINTFKLSTDQAEWTFANNKSLGWFEWDSIPYDAGQLPIDYSKYIAFAGMIDLAKQFTPVVDPTDAENQISFFSIASMLLPGSTATRAEFIEAFSLLTGYEKNSIDDIDAYLFSVFNFNNYKDVKTWIRVMNCAESLRTLGADISQVVEYIKPILLTNDVSLLRTALKARYDEDTWLGTLKEIMDSIRPQKRNALVAYLLAVNPEMKDENDLFDYFLVDVEMEACMPSSRIVQAHGTIQLFVQRCLMGLEPKAAADVDNDVNWKQWQWMKNYRVWEANRKVFLYPENWIEPDLRDDKSFLFTEFENELQQNELTNLTAEGALINYLEKLDNIAFLEVMATWYQSDIKTMHVFARTKGGDPAIYYYRRFEQERYWTPWEKVELDISGDQLLAFVRNNRLCLAWPMYTEEPDPNQKATIPPATANTQVNIDKPKRKLKIQLAISELANNKWQPKKVSKEGILTPSNYTTDELPKDIYNMLYFELGEQVWFFSTSLDIDEYQQINGIFNLTGCKGYPELVFQGSQNFPDFFPDFKDAWLKSQRYNEANMITGDELAVRNGISLFQFYEILHKTPGNFRLTYPHQFTSIDLIVLLFEYLLLQVLKNNTFSSDHRWNLKIPLGTLLPYFEEDSKHAYVIIPGFYKLDKEDQTGDTIPVKRTGSDVMQLIEDIFALFNKYLAKYQADPTQDINALIAELLADNEYQRIVSEFKVYGTLKYGEQFKNMYHPLVCPLKKTLYKDGIPELMKRETQLQKSNFDFKSYYEPNSQVVPKLLVTNENGTKSLTYPIEDLDFTSDGSYSCYNWELFFHVPLLLASRLTQNQKFEDALTWFHYMFNPTGALKGNTPQKYWVTKPFYLNQDADYINQRIDTLLYKIADPTTPERIELEFAINQWRDKPFKPDVVARFRPVAYQKALLMKYINNLTEWGDYLFRQDTMESIAQATQMYILADKLLGPKPRIVPPVVKAPYETYNQIENKLDAFGNALIDLENILPDLSVLPEGGDELPPPPFTLSML
ncbi:MAG TPA: neuraminidase-like domain-containing protein, partial [Bacteroidia bacterium]|nr:neuraminidase-like domain-containing protein [Bacteroidia bacterium]